MASPAVTSTTASGRHGVEVAPASRHSAETRRIVCMVRVRSSFIDETGEMGTIPTGEVGYMCRKSLGEAKRTETRPSLPVVEQPSEPIQRIHTGLGMIGPRSAPVLKLQAWAVRF